LALTRRRTGPKFDVSRISKEAEEALARGCWDLQRWLFKARG